MSITEEHKRRHDHNGHEYVERCFCGDFVSPESLECHEHGKLARCHCDDLKPVVTYLSNSVRVKCGCTGSSTGKCTVPV